MLLHFLVFHVLFSYFIFLENNMLLKYYFIARFQLCVLPCHELDLVVLANLIVYCNPGEVFYQIVGKQEITHLWAGDVNADMRYTPSASGANLVFFQSNRSELNSLWASFFSGVPGQGMVAITLTVMRGSRTCWQL